MPNSSHQANLSVDNADQVSVDVSIGKSQKLHVSVDLLRSKIEQTEEKLFKVFKVANAESRAEVDDLRAQVFAKVDTGQQQMFAKVDAVESRLEEIMSAISILEGNGVENENNSFEATFDATEKDNPRRQVEDHEETDELFQRFVKSRRAFVGYPIQQSATPMHNSTSTPRRSPGNLPVGSSRRYQNTSWAPSPTPTDPDSHSMSLGPLAAAGRARRLTELNCQQGGRPRVTDQHINYIRNVNMGDHAPSTVTPNPIWEKVKVLSDTSKPAFTRLEALTFLMENRHQAEVILDLAAWELVKTVHYWLEQKVRIRSGLRLEGNTSRISAAEFLPRVFNEAIDAVQRQFDNNADTSQTGHVESVDADFTSEQVNRIRTDKLLVLTQDNFYVWDSDLCLTLGAYKNAYGILTGVIGKNDRGYSSLCDRQLGGLLSSIIGPEFRTIKTSVTRRLGTEGHPIYAAVKRYCESRTNDGLINIKITQLRQGPSENFEEYGSRARDLFGEADMIGSVITEGTKVRAFTMGLKDDRLADRCDDLIETHPQWDWETLFYMLRLDLEKKRARSLLHGSRIVSSLR